MPHPNVLVFMTDQQRADTLPGSSPVDVHAPHRNWLAQQGTQFTSAFCTTPLCSPARTSLFTGLYPHASGVQANSTPGRALSADARFMGESLQEVGYHCGYVGKWHIPTAGRRPGFTDFVRTMGGTDARSGIDDALNLAQMTGINAEIEHSLRTYVTPPEEVPSPSSGRTTRLPLAYHHGTLMAGEAAGFIRAQARRDEPFLLAVSVFEPHPFGLEYDIVPAPFDRMYEPADMPLPASRRDPGAGRLVAKRGLGIPYSADDMSDDEVREKIAGYYAAVSYADFLLGTVLQALLATDQFEDTLIIFTSDHGEMLGSHGLLKKGPVLYEELVNVPLVIKTPGDAGARRSDQLVSHVDLLPTVLDLCGLDIPGTLHGSSLAGLLRGEQAPLRDGVALSYHARKWGEEPIPMRGWRTTDWKYVETRDGTNELYYLRRDPRELQNLAGDAKFSSEEGLLREQLHAWLQSVGDPWPLAD